MKKRILIAPNAFKHALSAIEVANIIKSSLEALSKDLICEIMPIADGGDGTSEVFNFYFKKSKFIECTVHDPLMRKIKSKWLLLDKETAVVELAKASGLSLLKEDELNPMWANTYGTGELILSALNEDTRKIIITLGGSATVDAGIGILTALGMKVFDKKKHLLKPGGGFLNSIETIDLTNLNKRVKDCKMHLMCDVKIPLCGEKGTVERFAAQKGAKEGERFILEAGMKRIAKIAKDFTGFECQDEPMVGSAGGVAFSLKSFLGAELYLGFLYLSNLINLEEKIKGTNLIITGEGSLDLQTLMGKGVHELAKLASKFGKKVIALCGTYDDKIDWNANNIYKVIRIQPEGLTLIESIRNTENLIKKAIKDEFGFVNC